MNVSKFSTLQAIFSIAVEHGIYIRKNKYNVIDSWNEYKLVLGMFCGNIDETILGAEWILEVNGVSAKSAYEKACGSNTQSPFVELDRNEAAQILVKDERNNFIIQLLSLPAFNPVCVRIIAQLGYNYGMFYSDAMDNLYSEETVEFVTNNKLHALEKYIKM